MSDNKEQVLNYTPEQIAEALFSQYPKDPNSFQILARPDSNTDDMTYIFEILVTILLEGLNYMTTNGLDNIEIDDFSEDYIEALKPWFNSICFNLSVEVYDEDRMYKCKKYYCKTVVKNKENMQYFHDNNIKKNYHFLLNAKYDEYNKSVKDLKDLYVVFVNNGKVYKISFDFYSSLDSCKSNKLQ
jgi:hypothetical protein